MVRLTEKCFGLRPEVSFRLFGTPEQCSRLLYTRRYFGSSSHFPIEYHLTLFCPGKHSFMVGAMDSLQLCHEGQPVSSAHGTARVVKRSLWFLACAGAATLLLSPVGHALRHQEGNGLRAKELPTKPEEVAGAVVCVANTAKAHTATLSEANRKVSLQCAQGEEVVPGLTEGLVCPEGTTTLTTCKTEAENNKAKAAANTTPVSLSVLMGGTAEAPVKWTESAATEGTGGNKYELSLPDAPLPLVDSEFVTGCIPTPPGQPGNECKLTVTVEARKSVAAGQTVYCAYGAKSNVAKPTVTMTQQNNTVTLVCGTDAINAVAQPTDYKTAYCADDNVGAGCKKETFTTFIPGFQPTWWTGNKGPKNVTLTIPPEHFPDSPKTIHLGCLYTPTETVNAQDAPAANHNLCKVDVVISAKERSASGRTAAALPGLTVGAAVLSISFLMWF